jgi:6-phosphogluconolactonase
MVPHSDAASNHRAMIEHVYSQPFFKRGDAKQVQPVNTALSAADAAAEYEARLLAEFGGSRGAVPPFDVVLLGVGDDGHTASLWEPAATAFDITREPMRTHALRAADNWAGDGRASGPHVRLVLPVAGAPKPPAERVTLTLSVINSANNVAVFASGADKAAALTTVLEQVSLRFSSRNRGQPLPHAAVAAHLPAALIGQLDGAWPAAYFVDAAAASRIAPAAAPAPATAARAAAAVTVAAPAAVKA